MSRLIPILPILLMASVGFASEHEWKPVQKSSLLSGVSVTGRVVPQDGALLIESARVQGRVTAIMRREGDPVVSGTPLYAISSAECFSLVEERRVAVSKQLPELIQGIERREKQLGLKLRGDQCLVVSSRAGVLTKRNLETGASFNLGDPLATTLDTRKLTIELDIPERDQARVRPGQKVTFRFASNSEQTFEALIETAVPTIDPSTRTSKAKLSPTRLPANVSLDALIYGDVDTGQKEPALIVPSSALVFYHNQQFVVAGGKKTPVAVGVIVLNETDKQSVVRPEKEGTLKEGDLVATQGAIYLLKQVQHPEMP